MRTQVAIVGAGPAGLVLAHLLHRRGIDSVVLERHTREYVERRIRAGVLEHGTVELLRRVGLAERLDREGMVHHGLELQVGRIAHRIDLTALTGRAITIYGQHELVKDLIAARLATGRPLLFSAPATGVGEIGTSTPVVWFEQNGRPRELRADLIAGCDGFHSVTRPAWPAQIYTHDYRRAWLGILAQAPPSSPELIYANHENGFALHSMRSPELTRLYLEVAPDENLDAWPDERIWAELATRLSRSDMSWKLNTGPVLEKGITVLRGMVTDPMQRDNLFLAGDAAHIVPATGAKGLNLAIADVLVLARAIHAFYAGVGRRALGRYSATCLARVWRVQQFSAWLTGLLHHAPDPFTRRLQGVELTHLTSSTAAATAFAEVYAGLPLPEPHPGGARVIGAD